MCHCFPAMLNYACRKYTKNIMKFAILVNKSTKLYTEKTVTLFTKITVTYNSEKKDVKSFDNGYSQSIF